MFLALFAELIFEALIGYFAVDFASVNPITKPFKVLA
jgi:hypothetical protein